MASIPSYAAKNRGPQAQIVERENPRDAARMGNAMANFGQNVHQFGGQIGQYLQERKKVDNKLYEAAVREQAINVSSEAMTFAQTNPNGAPDGSTAQTDFGTQFKPLREKALEEKDSDRKAIALQVLNDIEASSRSKLVTYQVNRHNEYAVEQWGERVNGFSIRAQNDPSQIGEVLKEFDELQCGDAIWWKEC